MALTAEQRRQRNAERMRKKRAEERAAAAGDDAQAEHVHSAQHSAPPAPPVPPPTTMQDAVASALAAMKWLVESDDGAVAQAKLLAQDVDELRHAGETTKSLSAQRALTTVLDRLGGTPTMRMHQELRSRRGGDQPEVPDDDDEAPTGDNVSKFQRPAGRRQA